MAAFASAHNSNPFVVFGESIKLLRRIVFQCLLQVFGIVKRLTEIPITASTLTTANRVQQIAFKALALIFKAG